MRDQRGPLFSLVSMSLESDLYSLFGKIPSQPWAGWPLYICSPKWFPIPYLEPYEPWSEVVGNKGCPPTLLSG